MAEYTNGVNAFGNMAVTKQDRASDVQTGRAVFVDEDKYANDAQYKAKVDKCLAEGFHRVTEGSGGGGDSDFFIAQVTIVNNTNQLADLGDKIQIAIDAVTGNDVLKVSSVGADALGSSTYKLVYYKDIAISIPMVSPFSYSVSGDAVMTLDSILVTGDCTITLSGSQA